MATVNYDQTVLRQKHAELITWEGLAGGDVGSSYELPFWAGSATMQAIGTFDGNTLTIQGSNDGSNWSSLTDPQGNAIAVTSASLEVVEEYPRYIRPSLGGSGGDVDILLFVRR